MCVLSTSITHPSKTLTVFSTVATVLVIALTSVSSDVSIKTKISPATNSDILKNLISPLFSTKYFDCCVSSQSLPSVNVMFTILVSASTLSFLLTSFVEYVAPSKNVSKFIC